MKKLIIGTLAHVDAGKTTLNESLLYQTGVIRKLGRVDNQDAYLDYNSIERKRGITIYSKEARIQYKNREYIMIDTPGHVDFSSEMERTLKILDYAIIVLSATSLIQSHTRTIWNYLEKYHIPTIIFINKMDISYQTKEELLASLQQNLNENCIEIGNHESYEAIALTSDSLLQYFMQHSTLTKQQIQQAFVNRTIFPCVFGSALKNNGITELLDTLDAYAPENEYPEEFGAICYKIDKDEKNNRLTHLKITGGSLQVKEILKNEKIDELRLYNGTKYSLVNEIKAGEVVAIKGLQSSSIYDSYGYEEDTFETTSSYMDYSILIHDKVDAIKVYQDIKELAIEDPSLAMHYDANTKEIHVSLLGETQMEVLQSTILERYKYHISFGPASIRYKETITGIVEGIGHFEPLRHYSEVHVTIEALPRGSGIIVDSKCSLDDLSKNYQNQILQVLQEEHYGVLTGSPISDVKLTLVSGKAHLKHTEGGDMQEATRRAIRQGLKKATSILLEPYYDFEIYVDDIYVSKITYDLDNLHAHYSVTQTKNRMKISGFAPIYYMQNYPIQFASSTSGTGELSFHFKGYGDCVHTDEVLAKYQYNSEEDTQNPTGSIFCAHGAGFYVPYDQVEKYMHLPSVFEEKEDLSVVSTHKATNKYKISEAELDAIIKRSFSPTKRYKPSIKEQQEEKKQQEMRKSLLPCVIVDGYNIIHAWEDLQVVAKEDMYAARLKLIDFMNDYQGYKNCLLILVFDAYLVKENPGTIIKQDNIYIVYTKEKETADSYIEKQHTI